MTKGFLNKYFSQKERARRKKAKLRKLKPKKRYKTMVAEHRDIKTGKKVRQQFQQEQPPKMKLTRIQKAQKQYQEKGYYETDIEGKPIFRNRFGFFTRGHGLIIRHHKSPYSEDKQN